MGCGMCRHWKGHGEEKVFPLREGDGTHSGGPQYFPAVSQLSCTTLGAVPLQLGYPSSTIVGTKTGYSTLRSLWRGLDGQWAIDREPWGATGGEAAQLADTGPPHTHPTAIASLQDAALCLVPLHSLVTTFSCVTAAGREQALK